MIRKILVALDGSEPSRRALDYAVELANKWGAELTLLTVVPRMNPLALPGEEESFSVQISAATALDRERVRDLYGAVLRRAEEGVRREHPRVRIVARLGEGRPSATIVEVAEDEGFDLIVVGSRGLGCIMGWILGSTSRRVADSCTRPVLIVK